MLLLAENDHDGGMIRDYSVHGAVRAIRRVLLNDVPGVFRAATAQIPVEPHRTDDLEYWRNEIQRLSGNEDAGPFPEASGMKAIASPQPHVSIGSPAPALDTPVVFVSYPWDSPRHKLWVLDFAERLRHEGIDVILDQWHLKPGHDRTHFMESSVRRSDSVLLVCTPEYARKSNGRSGGVGYEATILTGQLARNATQNKLIPVLRLGGWDDSAIPIWLQTKIGVDLRDEPYAEGEYEQLVLTLHDAHEPPPAIGPKPKNGF